MLDDRMGALLRDHLESLAGNLPYMHPEESENVADATCRVPREAREFGREALAHTGNPYGSWVHRIGA